MVNKMKTGGTAGHLPGDKIQHTCTPSSHLPPRYADMLRLPCPDFDLVMRLRAAGPPYLSVALGSSMVLGTLRQGQRLPLSG
jgi:hypothetical protein